MSLETTLARAAFTAADDAWKLHKRQCAGCSVAARHRRWDQLCAPGGTLREAQVQASAELKRNRELDRQPSPDQPPLF